MKKRIDQPNPVFGFTWVQTDESYYIQSTTGDLMRVSDAAFAIIERVAAGEISRNELNSQTAEMIDRIEEDYFRPDEPVIEIVPPTDITFWPRVLLFLLLIIIGIIASVTNWQDLIRVQNLIQPLKIALFIFAILMSIVIHELGHYFASRRFISPSIGFRTVNGVVPAFVTDTTEAWILPKNRRRWINLAGPFAELVWTNTLILTYYVLFPDNKLLLLIIINAFLQSVFALNPFIHGDGYFLLVDTFGLGNFRNQGIVDIKNKEITIESVYILSSYIFGGLLTLSSLYVATTVYGSTGLLIFLVFFAIALFDLQRFRLVFRKARNLWGY